ncbi:Signal peptide, CUB and EGF-like domain-containing protein 3, partial [Stegodyphus mimosarum]
SVNNGGCDHTCISSLSTVQCLCHEGFQLRRDKKTCQDVDECNETPCNHICRNTLGSFECACKDGYELGLDG